MLETTRHPPLGRVLLKPSSPAAFVLLGDGTGRLITGLRRAPIESNCCNRCSGDAEDHMYGVQRGEAVRAPRLAWVSSFRSGRPVWLPDAALAL